MKLPFQKKRFIGIYCSALLALIPPEYRYIWTHVLFFQPNRNSFSQNYYFFVTTYESLKYSCSACKWNQWLFQVCININVPAKRLTCRFSITHIQWFGYPVVPKTIRRYIHTIIHLFLSVFSNSETSKILRV